MRISYKVTRPAMVSVMSQQEGNTFAPFTTSNGKPLNLLAMGSVPAGDMISREEAKNTAWTWGLRRFYRPLIGVPLAVAGIGLVVVLIRFVLKARASRATAPAVESAKVEPTEVEPSKVESTHVETTQVEPAKVETVQRVADDVSIEDLDDAISV